MTTDTSAARCQGAVRSASTSQAAPKDLSRFEGEGGGQIAAEETKDKPAANALSWKEIVARYQNSSTKRGIWQIVNTLIPYAALWYLMYLTAPISWWLTTPLAVLAAAFLVRIFIISHDCGHGSFFKSPRANHVVGAFASFLVFTPYLHWRWEHSLHHATSGDLDRRGTGDIWTLTVQEYLQASRWKRFAYRLVRNPVVLFVIAPLFVFLIKHRFAKSRAGKRQRRSVYWTNLAILSLAVALSWIFGLKEYLIIQMVVMATAGSTGIWLFYVQHQFEGVYWQRSDDWDYATAALQGSSFYKLPKILQWFSGNIGFHHIHHLSPRIPNYHLEKCHNAEPLFQTVKPVTLFSSLKSFTFRLWDEQRHNSWDIATSGPFDINRENRCFNDFAKYPQRLTPTMKL
jgi:acyl-lipid omega-6 desaturase (Delta-12 desaturase)